MPESTAPGKKIAGWSGLAAALAAILYALSGGGGRPRPAPVPRPNTCNQATRQQEFTETCTDVLHRELGATRDPALGGALNECMRRANACENRETITAWVHNEPEAVAYRNRPPDPIATLPSAGEAGPLTVAGTSIHDQHNQEWRYKGATDFLLLRKWLDGQDIQPILTQRIRLGANTVRVLMVKAGVPGAAGFAGVELRPGTYTDQQLHTFIDLLAGRGVRVEAVVIADANPRPQFGLVGTLPDVSQQRAWVTRLAAVFASHWNVIAELCNECSHLVSQVDRNAFSKPQGPTLWERGSGQADEDPFTPPWDLIGDHPGRVDEWPRRLSCRDFRDQQHVPCIENEPMGASAIDQPGKRSNKPDDFAYWGAMCGMNSNGCLFHSDNGVLSDLWGPVEEACAKAFYDAMAWVPKQALIWPYRRGGLSGPMAPIIDHRDDQAIRTFCKENGQEGFCVAVRPTAAWKAQGVDGWRVDSEPRRGLVHLVKP